ncbi:arginine--tRNA ligase [Ancylomarina euxinus]|uniref:Arginine--tRNA ligase n=1 Tax=Ancylomarina euxinus TaxID=2283627 RepID=A0A425XXF5_9BACT|nr:arginine--tRNA ligase [Ancylomarina euxinus]MCZ4696105.1 arginine--tRNA ligase [Ancylomarina euxinus]MUP16514.1 arginine--tRNA ligase [Ancylomarina euxinus]RRG19336.1 arginine--tRNA ligase [Ancylomarina euxinus]
MSIESIIKGKVVEAISACYGQKVEEDSVQIQKTRREFEGDLTVVVFPFLRFSKKSPEETANDLGNFLQENIDAIPSFNIVKGFLNLVIDNSYWLSVLNEAVITDNYGFIPLTEGAKKVMIEYSSPNTNKPLHLGHIRNNLLGYSVAQILKANGLEVIKVNLVNDRGIHICKSMLAWLRFGEGETPESTGIKGDHLVGKYYVRFDQEYKKEIEALIAGGMDADEAKKKAPLLLEAQEMLVKWEAGDEETVALWRKMNDWVLAGFEITYKTMGVDFDKVYFESDTYKKGKAIVMRGLDEGVLYQKETGSVWADLESDGLDHKLLLRDDGTSVYMTQDIGTAYERFNEFHIDEHIYVVGNEQNYHFQVLSLIMGKLGYEWHDKIHHLSYGMVELPEGKMKSREGTVVDADDLMKEMVNTARETSEELGKLAGYSKEEAEDVYNKVAMGALKYFILKVDPKKNMMFNPKDSIDFNGNTGPFIQYTYTRIQSVLRKATESGMEIPELAIADLNISEKESFLIQILANYPNVIKDAGRDTSPALISNYVYDLSKEYNQFYHDFPMNKEENEDLRNFRFILSKQVAGIIKSGMSLLGVSLPERM